MVAVAVLPISAHQIVVLGLVITALHLTRKQLAKKLRITRQTVSKIEKHDNNVTIGTLEKIASIFHKQLAVEFR